MSHKHTVLRVTFSLSVAAIGATTVFYCLAHPPIFGFGVITGLMLLAWGLKLLFDRDYAGIGTVMRTTQHTASTSDAYGPAVNPTTGLTLQPGGVVDVGGNAYGTRRD